MKSKKLGYFVVIILALFCFGYFSCSSVNLPVELKSPDGDIVLQFKLTENGEPNYSVVFKNNPIIKESRLGFQFIDRDPFAQNLKVKNIKTSTHSETYSMVYGSEKEIKNHYNEMILSLKELDSQRKYDLVEYSMTVWPLGIFSKNCVAINK